MLCILFMCLGLACMDGGGPATPPVGVTTSPLVVTPTVPDPAPEAQPPLRMNLNPIQFTAPAGKMNLQSIDIQNTSTTRLSVAISLVHSKIAEHATYRIKHRDCHAVSAIEGMTSCLLTVEPGQTKSILVEFRAPRSIDETFMGTTDDWLHVWVPNVNGPLTAIPLFGEVTGTRRN